MGIAQLNWLWETQRWFVKVSTDDNVEAIIFNQLRKRSSRSSCLVKKKYLDKTQFGWMWYPMLTIITVFQLKIISLQVLKHGYSLIELIERNTKMNC